MSAGKKALDLASAIIGLAIITELESMERESTMASWHLDEGLVTLRAEWKRDHPDAVVGTIAGGGHVATWPQTDHAPEPQGTAPGQDQGEVDAADFMEGNGVTHADLRELWDGLLASRDRRILFVILDGEIFSSVVQPFVIRDYHGKDPHTRHLHISVNDLFDNNTSDWHWEKAAMRTLKFTTVSTALPTSLQLGDEDTMFDGYNHIGRAQALANWLDHTTADVDTDGVYGPKSAAKFARALGRGNGRKLATTDLKQLHGLS